MLGKAGVNDLLIRIQIAYQYADLPIAKALCGKGTNASRDGVNFAARVRRGDSFDRNNLRSPLPVLRERARVRVIWNVESLFSV
jgi:hypothetical protein